MEKATEINVEALQAEQLARFMKSTFSDMHNFGLDHSMPGKAQCMSRPLRSGS